MKKLFCCGQKAVEQLFAAVQIGFSQSPSSLKSSVPYLVYCTNFIFYIIEK